MAPIARFHYFHDRGDGTTQSDLHHKSRHLQDDWPGYPASPDRTSWARLPLLLLMSNLFNAKEPLAPLIRQSHTPFALGQLITKNREDSSRPGLPKHNLRPIYG